MEFVKVGGITYFRACVSQRERADEAPPVRKQKRAARDRECTPQEPREREAYGSPL